MISSSSIAILTDRDDKLFSPEEPRIQFSRIIIKNLFVISQWTGYTI